MTHKKIIELKEFVKYHLVSTNVHWVMKFLDVVSKVKMIFALKPVKKENFDILALERLTSLQKWAFIFVSS